MMRRFQNGPLGRIRNLYFPLKMHFPAGTSKAVQLND